MEFFGAKLGHIIFSGGRIERESVRLNAADGSGTSVKLRVGLGRDAITRLARGLSALRASQFARRAQYLEKKRDCFAVYAIRDTFVYSVSPARH